MADGTGSSGGGNSALLSVLLALAGGAQGYAQSATAGHVTKRAQQIQREQAATQKQQQNQTIALAESEQDPFREQMHQARDIGLLDRMENSSYTPVSVTPAARYAQYVPQVSGGYSYNESPDVRASAGALKKNVMGGNVAPSMTDPANFGKTATLDLVRMGANGVDPSRVNAAASAPADLNSYTANMTTRPAGGPFKAESRSTDLSVADATQVLDRAIRTELGRAPNPGEIEHMLASQGLRPGNQWVGRQGLMGLLQVIRTQAGPSQPSYTGRG